MKKLTKHLLLLAFVMAFAVSMAIVGGTAKRNEVFAEDEQSVSVPTKFTGTNVALDGGVIFNFHTDATTGDGSYVLVQFNDDQYALTENVGGTFKFYGIAPQQMGDTLTAELYTAADEKVATLAQTSVKATLESLLAMTQSSVGLDSVQYRAMKETVVDLLNYGASAQNYTNYKTDCLVNADLSEQDASLATAKKLNATSHRALSANNTMWRGANVIFDSRIGLMFAFKTADDNTGEASELEGYTITIDG
ncbi:MAG: hypothetical protein IJ811_00480, partial [Clostridia bacterium]|nr:hypothetical protein [Clostridia bacterium]